MYCTNFSTKYAYEVLYVAFVESVGVPIFLGSERLPVAAWPSFHSRTLARGQSGKLRKQGMEAAGKLSEVDNKTHRKSKLGS